MSCHVMPMVVLALLWSDAGARYTTLILMLILTTCTMCFGCRQFKISFQIFTSEYKKGGIHKSQFRNSTFLDSIGDPFLRIFPASPSSHQFPHFGRFFAPFNIVRVALRQLRTPAAVWTHLVRPWAIRDPGPETWIE